MATLAQIYDWFMTGKKPTQAQFWASWGSFWNKGETIPQSAISNLTTVLNAKTENDQFNAHKTAEDAHVALFLAKENITQKGLAGGYVPLDAFSKIAHQFLNIVNDLTTGGASSLLSAEQGVVLQTQIDGINVLLTSNDVNLDTVQEIVDAIKTVETSLSSILVNDLTAGGTTKALTAEMGKLLNTLKENTDNKSNSIATDYLSNIKFPSVKAVYDFVFSAFKKKYLQFGDVPGISHTFGAGVDNTRYKFTNNNPITAIIPTNNVQPYDVGTVFETIALGNGVLTVSGDVGVTLISNLSNVSVKNEIRRYAKIDVDTWTVEGNGVSKKQPTTTFYIDKLSTTLIGVEGDIEKPFKTLQDAISAFPQDNGDFINIVFLSIDIHVGCALPSRNLKWIAKGNVIIDFSGVNAQPRDGFGFVGCNVVNESNNCVYDYPTGNFGIKSNTPTLMQFFAKPNVIFKGTINSIEWNAQSASSSSSSNASVITSGYTRNFRINYFSVSSPATNTHVISLTTGSIISIGVLEIVKTVSTFNIWNQVCENAILDIDELKLTNSANLVLYSTGTSNVLYRINKITGTGKFTPSGLVNVHFNNCNVATTATIGIGGGTISGKIIATHNPITTGEWNTFKTTFKDFTGYVGNIRGDSDGAAEIVFKGNNFITTTGAIMYGSAKVNAVTVEDGVTVIETTAPTTGLFSVTAGRFIILKGILMTNSTNIGLTISKTTTQL